MKRTFAVCVSLLALAAPAAAQTPVAVVEEVQGKVTGAEFMDYVTPKTVIKLGDGGSVVISYMNSCRRETISGIGTVIVGTEESNVHLADVKAETTKCDSRQTHATTKATSEVAATVLRSVKKGKDADIQADLTLYGTSPLFEVKGKGTLVIDRLDVKGERQQVEINGKQLRGRFYDFAGTNRTLTPGGVYAATFASQRIVFRVDPEAKPGPTPIVGRLIRIQ
ncbi:hypothetical protein JQ628_04915 [Bradyrhizobium lablabi]|uniref:hypothetical protein n=1 Tax=Bradyrhizobium lablabi TaxID=722472 RepID=UPI001BAC9F97|nr:hypothetical protein [Bradyrhizobium lablabi]MBR1120849.1 hypothetical protein [Bradyrhizobium lablabi]